MNVKRTFCFMRIIAVTIVTLLFSIYATNAFSQNAKASINVTQQTTKDVLSKIEQQTDYLFVYNLDEINVDRKISLNVENEPVASILEQLFTGTNVTYLLSGNNISLVVKNSKKEKLQQQPNHVSGTILDESGIPIVGANVIIKGTNRGQVTDMNGTFTLEASKGSVLLISFIGFNNKEVKVEDDENLTIVLQENTKLLEEIVVVGYGVQRKSDVTGAVVSVKAQDAIKNTPTSTITDALQGRLAGVQIAGGGDPAKGASIRVRGINSMSGDAGPLVVIDGFIGGSLKNINPSDIKSIEVLKDASATAVYGSRGANGVILVTTKSLTSDKIEVDFNSFVNFKTIMKKPDVLNAAQYAELANDFRKEYYTAQSAQAPLYTEEEIRAFRSGAAGYNYIDNIFNDPAVSQNHDLSISGKKGDTQYLASIRFEDTKGILKKSKYRQYNWRLKLDTKIRRWLNIGLNLWGSYSEASGPRMSAYEGLLIQAINFAPTINPKNEKGEYNNIRAIDGTPSYNPMGYINEIDLLNRRLRNTVQGYANFNIADGLTFRTQVGIGFLNSLNQNSENDKSYFYFKNTYTNASAFSGWNFSFLNTNTLNYVKEFNENHRINATLVFEQSHLNNYTHKSEAMRLAFPNDLGYNALQYADDARVFSDLRKASLMSGLARVNYVLMNRYMLTASMRADGSSRLANKWDYFPSFALAWNVKEENFMKNVEWMDQFKLRAGYGVVGNQAVEIYRIYSKMDAVNLGGSTAYKLGRPAAEDLKWERNSQFNAGVDFVLLNGRVTATLDYYNKKSNDILLEVAQPMHTGWGTLLKNAGAIKNTGFELTLGATPISNKNWNWKTDVTLSHNKGVYSTIPTRNKMQTMGKAGLEAKLYKMIEGEKLGSFWGFTSDGIWQKEDVAAVFHNAKGETIVNKKTGQPKTNGEVYKIKPGMRRYADINKDGKYNEADQRIIGCGQPTFNWGWNNNISFKGFDLSIFVVGFHGFDIYNATRQSRFGNLPSTNVDFVTPNPEMLNRWRPGHEDTDIPGYVTAKGAIRDVISSEFIEKGDFIKVKSITLGYNIPKNLCSKIGLTNCRIYGSVQNPFLITDYSGLDPEAALGTPLLSGADWGAYPNSRNFLMGVNLSF